MPETNPNQQNLAELAIEELVASRSNETMPPEEVARVREWAIDLVGDCVNDALLDALSDEQLKELDLKVQQGISDEEMEQFFLNAGINYQPILEQALQNLLQQNGINGGQN